MQYLTELAKLVNTGRCWVVVGSGASCDLGVPSWPKLAERVLKAVENEAVSPDLATYKKLLESRKYPILFTLAESDLGGIERLCAVVESELVPIHQRGEFYKYLSEWPFACYLTTNFENSLKAHLDDTGTGFTVLNNTPMDFRKINAHSKGLIVRLHGNTQDPANIVLTSKQYADFRSSPGREYFRRKLESIFDMHDVVIMGYSLSDPDISFILERACQFASPSHPIYMIAADVGKGEAQELYETKNVRVISYPNEAGDHQALSRRLLPLMNRFIAPRVRGESPISSDPFTTDEAAASLYVYSRGQLMDPTYDAIDNALQALVLRTLARSGTAASDGMDSLAAELPLPELPEETRRRLEEAVERLQRQELLAVGPHGEIQLTSRGKEVVEDHEAEAEVLRQQVADQIALDFEREFPDSIQEEVSTFVGAALSGLDGALRRRGLTIASCTLGSQPASLHNGIDILAYLRDASNELESFLHRAFFIEYLSDSIVRPTDVFRKYLARQSQGYFAFHILGMHEGAALLRRQWLDSTVWILDSSVILPLLALHSYEHPFAAGLFERIRTLGLATFTTESLFDEVLVHARWAMSCVDKYGADSTEFMMIALLRGDYKQNLFIDGYIQAASANPALGFDSYMESIFGSAERAKLGEATKALLQEHNVRTERFSEWSGFSAVDWGERPYWTDLIRADREERRTFTRPSQCEAEAEVLILLKGERDGTLGAIRPGVPSRAYFVTHSGVLRRVSSDTDCLVWSPEALYRYLLLFPTSTSWSDDAVFEMIRSDLYLSGIPVIDTASYVKFFNPQITESNLRMQQAREIFAKGEAAYLESYTRFYDESVPDLEKPFYSLQVAWETAQREKERADRVAIVAPLLDKDRQELEKLRIEEKFRKQKAKHKKRSNEQKNALGNKKQRKRRKKK